MIKKDLLELIHQGAHIQRWNDHIRPKGFTELDKQAQKMVIAYLLARFEEDDKGIDVDWQKLIEGGMFEYLHRIVLTDIKPPIFYELMREHGQKLNSWVLQRLKNILLTIPDDFYKKFEAYLFDPNYSYIEKKILKGAHYLASNWEFKIIYQLNSGIFRIDETKSRIENELEDHYDLIGVQKVVLGKKTYNLLDIVGQLRFQQRWAQSPRVPETSVLGHMYIVAIIAYLCTLQLKPCKKRICNNFFAGLFHDLPEVLTRDIISPVKNSVEGLEKLIKNIENRQMEEKILPLLPFAWHKEIKYFIENEFSSKILCDDKVVEVTSEDINKKYNEDSFSPIDGQIIKACDHLAAFIETTLSISHGITSKHLVDGHKSIYTQYEQKNIAGINFGQLFNYFKVI